MKELEPVREYKLEQLQRHMAKLRPVKKVFGSLTLGEAENEDIAADLIDRKDRLEQAAGIIRRDLGMRTRTPKVVSTLPKDKFEKS